MFPDMYNNHCSLRSSITDILFSGYHILRHMQVHRSVCSLLSVLLKNTTMKDIAVIANILLSSTQFERFFRRSSFSEKMI